MSYASIFAYFAFFSINSLRGGTSSPINIEKNTIGLPTVFDTYLAKFTSFRIHGRIPKLFRIHFPKTFVSLDLNSSIIFRSDRVTLLFIPGIALFASFFSRGKAEALQYRYDRFRSILSYTGRRRSKSGFRCDYHPHPHHT